MTNKRIPGDRRIMASGFNKVYEGTIPLTAPVITDGTLFVLGAVSGHLLRFDATSRQLVPILETHGAPTGAAADPKSGDVFLCDNARQSVVKVETEDGAPSLSTFLEQFEGKPFRGPNQCCFDAAGELYFTDSGSFGDTNLANPRGAVFRTVQGRQQVVPLAPPCLAYPTGIACSPNGCVYVCELHANRVLRFAQRPNGVYHGSVFVQLSGGVGPMAVAVSPKGDVYVAKYDFATAQESSEALGVVLGFSFDGEAIGSIQVPGTEISGLAIDASNNLLYITERNSIYSAALR